MRENALSRPNRPFFTHSVIHIRKAEDLTIPKIRLKFDFRHHVKRQICGDALQLIWRVDLNLCRTYLRTGILIWTFLTFWVLIGSLFIFQGPYFQCFGFIHVKNVNFFKNTATRKHVFINHWSVIWWVKCGIVIYVISEIVIFGAFLYFLCLRVNFLYLPFLGHLFFLGSLLGPYFIKKKLESYWVPIPMPTGS